MRNIDSLSQQISSVWLCDDIAIDSILRQGPNRRAFLFRDGRWAVGKEVQLCEASLHAQAIVE